MDAMNNYYNQPNMGMNGYQMPGAMYNPAYGYSYPMFDMTQGPVPMNSTNAISPEEMAMIKSKPNAFDTSITQEQQLQSMCTHIDANGRDALFTVNDGTGDVVCKICGARFHPESADKDKLVDAINTIENEWQVIKYTQCAPREMVREFGPVVSVIKKLPDIAAAAGGSIDRMFGYGNPIYGNDVSSNMMFNSLMHGMGMGYNGMPMQGYPNGYYQQVPQQQPVNYAQQQSQYVVNPYQPNPTAVGNPAVNPMQAPTGGVNPMASNQQFGQQANMMMGGSVYGQPMYQPYTPQQQLQQVNPVQQPVASGSENKAPNGPTVAKMDQNGNVVKSDKISL